MKSYVVISSPLKCATCRENTPPTKFNTRANDIYDYVQEVNPKHIVTDHSQSKHAKQLAKMVEQKFPSIRTEYHPQHN